MPNNSGSQQHQEFIDRMVKAGIVPAASATEFKEARVESLLNSDRRKDPAPLIPESPADLEYMRPDRSFMMQTATIAATFSTCANASTTKILQQLARVRSIEASVPKDVLPGQKAEKKNGGPGGT